MTEREQNVAIGTVASLDGADHSYVVVELYEDPDGKLAIGIGRWCECAERGRHKIGGVGLRASPRILEWLVMASEAAMERAGYGGLLEMKRAVERDEHRRATRASTKTAA